MAERTTPEDAISRREFLRKGGAVGVGLGMTLDASTTATAVGMPAFPGPCSTDVVSVPESAIKDLRNQLDCGKVLAPGDLGYAMRGLPANGRYRDISPAVIARCEDEDDVVKCVKWCKKSGISPVVRGGGHSYAGFSTTTGLLIDIGRLNSVKVDKDGVAVAGALLLTATSTEKPRAANTSSLWEHAPKSALVAWCSVVGSATTPAGLASLATVWSQPGS